MERYLLGTGLLGGGKEAPRTLPPEAGELKEV